MYDVIVLMDHKLIKTPFISGLGNASMYTFSITRQICVEDYMRMSIISAITDSVRITDVKQRSIQSNQREEHFCSIHIGVHFRKITVPHQDSDWRLSRMMLLHRPSNRCRRRQRWLDQDITYPVSLLMLHTIPIVVACISAAMSLTSCNVSEVIGA